MVEVVGELVLSGAFVLVGNGITDVLPGLRQHLQELEERWKKLTNLCREDAS